MFRIGDFSRIARVSLRLLRYYDEIGLLRPCRVDARSGYRYYSAAQLPELNRILVLKELGLSLEQIAKALARDVGASELRGMLELRRADLEQSLQAEAARLRQVESRLSQLESKGEPMADDVILRAEPARRVLSTRARLPSFAEGLLLVGELLDELPRRRPLRGALGELAVIAHAPAFDPEDLDVEMGFYLRDDARPDDLPELEPLRSGRKLQLRELPAAPRVAACVRVGEPHSAHAATAQIGRFVEGNGLQLAGPSREVFLRRPDPARLNESVVEMVFPVAPA